MGESFLGLPNRFKIINNLLESTYNPNHALSAYQGYRLATDYVNRAGGEDFAMTGNLHTKSLLPSVDAYYGKYGTMYGDDIGSSDMNYRYIYAQYIHGTAQDAIQLKYDKKISLTGSVTGEVTTNFSGDVTINTITNHNHDSLYLKLTGGTLKGHLFMSAGIIPTTTKLYNLGTVAQVWNNIYASTVTADTFTGNAATATRLATARTVTVCLSPSMSASNNSSSATFDGTKDISIAVPAPYLPINGGTLTGKLTMFDSIIPGNPEFYDIGTSYSRWNSIYGKTFYGDTFNGVATSASKLEYSRNIKVVLNNSSEPTNNYGSASFDGSGDVAVNVNAPYLPINGGSVSGNILPKTTNVYYLGNSSYKFNGIYANNLYGNADTSTKLATARTLTIGSAGKTFDGSANVSWSLAEMGAASASVVANIGTTTAFKKFNYSFSSGNDEELCDSVMEFYGDSEVAHTLEAGTYIIITRLVGNFLARLISVGIATGTSVDSVSPIEATYTTMPSTPIVVTSSGTVKARENTFIHRIPSVTIQTFSSKTVVVPFAEIIPSPNWGGNTMYYTFSIRCIRIK